MTVPLALAIFTATLVLVHVVGPWGGRLRGEVRRPAFWGALIGTAGVLSLLSAGRAQVRRAGTGFSTEYGWPKPFYAQASGNGALAHDGWSWLHFSANTQMWLAGILLMWTVWRLISTPR